MKWKSHAQIPVEHTLKKVRLGSKFGSSLAESIIIRLNKKEGNMDYRQVGNAYHSVSSVQNIFLPSSTSLFIS